METGLEAAQFQASAPRRVSSVSISLSALIVALILAVTLISMNTVLLLKNQALRKQLQSLLRRNFAPVGTTLEKITGHAPGGQPVDLDVEHSAPLIFMIFDPHCAVCDRNWPNWDKMMSDPQLQPQAVFLSAAGDELPDSYLEKHPVLRRKSVVGLDPNIIRSFNLSSSPQTFIVERGTIMQNWPSLLSDGDIREIKSELLKLNRSEAKGE